MAIPNLTAGTLVSVARRTAAGFVQIRNGRLVAITGPTSLIIRQGVAFNPTTGTIIIRNVTLTNVITVRRIP